MTDTTEGIAKCEAVSKKTGKRCRNDAVGDTKFCGLPAHKSQTPLTPEELLAKAAAKAAALIAPISECIVGLRECGELFEFEDPYQRPQLDAAEDPLVLSDKFLKALDDINEAADYPTLFKSGTKISRRYWEARARDSRHGKAVEGSPMVCVPRLEVIEKPTLSRLSLEAAQFVIYTKDGVKPVITPGYLIDGVLTETAPPFPIIGSIGDVPIIGSDGTVLATPGFSGPPDYRLYLPDEHAGWVAARDVPTERDLVRAVEVVDELYSDYLFKDLGSATNVRAHFLTPPTRALYPFAPLFGYGATQPQVGKTKAAYCTQATWQGYTQVQGIAESGERFTQAFHTMLRSGELMPIFDNTVEGSVFDSAAMASFLTSSRYASRVLGKEDGFVVVNQHVITMTGNRLGFTRELLERLAIVDIEPQPEGHHFALDLPEAVHANRPKYVWAAHTLIRNWYAQGCPVPEGSVPACARRGLFHHGWASVVGPILWLGAEFSESPDDWTSLLGNSSSAMVEKSSFSAGEALVAAEVLADVAGDGLVTAGQALLLVSGNPELRLALMDHLEGADDEARAKSFGALLKRVKEQSVTLEDGRRVQIIRDKGKYGRIVYGIREVGS